MRADPAQVYIRARLQLISDLAADTPVSPSAVERIVEAEEAVRAGYSDGAAEFVFRRAEQAVGEVFSGKLAPPQMQLGRDSIARVEVDYFAENIVAEAKARMKPLTAAQWKAVHERLKETLARRERSIAVEPIRKALAAPVASVRPTMDKPTDFVRVRDLKPISDAFEQMYDDVIGVAGQIGEFVREAITTQTRIAAEFDSTSGELVLRVEFDSKALGTTLRGPETRIVLPAPAPQKSLADSFAGPWQQRWYDPGQLVQHAGSCWIATEHTSRKPGGPDSGWQVVAKRGRDAR